MYNIAKLSNNDRDIVFNAWIHINILYGKLFISLDVECLKYIVLLPTSYSL